MNVVHKASAMGLLGLGMLGCGGGWGMAAPLDVTNISEELPITNRSSFSGALANESFGMGSYRVTDVDRKWNSTSSRSFAGMDSSRTKGGYAYKFAGASGTLSGACATEQSEKGTNLGGGLEFSKLVAKLGCFCSGDRGDVTLEVHASTTKQFVGEVKGADYAYQVTAITERENGRMASHDPLGYRVDGEGPIGAVGVVKPGRVWISKSLDEAAREDLGCLFAGLMLYEPPKDR